MKRHVLTATLVATVVVVMAACEERVPTDVPIVDSPSLSKASHTEISGVFTLYGVGDCSWWVNPGGVYHDRDCETLYMAGEGDLVATGRLLENGNVKLANGNGSASGPMHLDVSKYGDADVTGTLSGQVAFRCSGWYCTSDFVLHGGGDLEGLKFNLHMEGWFSVPSDFAYTGTVTNPHGG